VNKIKVIKAIEVVEGLKPWEIMKAFEEGKRIAFAFKGGCDWSVNECPTWNWVAMDYAVIDDSHPGIPWDEFDWEFFNQYGGLTVYTDRVNGIKHWGDYEYLVEKNGVPVGVQESPWYPWFGGKQPVPDCVEVEVEKVTINYAACTVATSIIRKHETMLAKNVVWDWRNIVAFRLTGNIKEQQ